jgi:hypothetical protein
MRIRLAFILPTLIALGCGRSTAQICQDAPSLADYLGCEIRAREHLAEDFVAKQVTAPAAALNSMALADSAAAPDLFGASLSPALFATRSLSPNADDFAGIINL